MYFKMVQTFVLMGGICFLTVGSAERAKASDTPPPPPIVEAIEEATDTPPPPPIVTETTETPSIASEVILTPTPPSETQELRSRIQELEIRLTAIEKTHARTTRTARARVWTDHQGVWNWIEAEQLCRRLSARLPTLVDFLELEEKSLVTGLDNEEYSFWISETGRKIRPGISSGPAITRSRKNARPIHWSFSTRREDRSSNWKNRISRDEKEASVRCIKD